MNPALVLIVLGMGLLALVPARRLAERSGARGVVTVYFVGLWLLLLAVAAAPPTRRLAVPLAIALVVLPWIQLPTPIARILGLEPRDRRPPPRDVTPPDA